MTLPLIVLAFLSAVGGWLGIPKAISDILPGNPENFLEHWFDGVIKPIPGMHEADPSMEWTLMGISVGIALMAAALAYHFYVQRPEKPEKFAKSIGPIYKVVYNKYFVDEFYFGAIINPLVRVSKDIWYYIDVNVIDGATYGITNLVRGAGQFARGLQNGNIQVYAMYISLGMVATLLFLLVR